MEVSIQLRTQARGARVCLRAASLGNPDSHIPGFDAGSVHSYDRQLNKEVNTMCVMSGQKGGGGEGGGGERGGGGPFKSTGGSGRVDLKSHPFPSSK